MNFTIKKNNRKYIAVLILFLVLLLFGKNYTAGGNSINSTIESLQKEIKSIKKGVYTIKPQDKPLTINLPTSYKKGDSARLIFNIETKNELMSQIYEQRQMDFSIYLASDYGEEQLIDNLMLTVPVKNTLQEIRFTSEFDSSKLIIKRNDSRTTGELTISDLKSFKLNAGANDLNNLKPTISGKTDVLEVVSSTADKFDGKFLFAFTRKKQLIGQVFSANYDKISSVDLALGWLGNGGSGNYLLELRRVQDDGSYSDVLSHYFFNQESTNDNLVSNNVYRLPFTANLIKGKKYMISINNYNVSFNLINTLKIGSVNIKDSEVSEARMTVGGGKEKLINPLFIEVKGSDCIKNINTCVLNGAIIQDNGGGTGLYNYESTGEPIDFLDLYKSDPGVGFDNVVGGIIAPVKADTTFYYQFDTVYPYKVMKVIIDQNVLYASKNNLSYSFDNQNWETIDQNENGNLIVEKVIKPLSNHQTNLFIKVTYDPSDAKYKESAYFGIKGIKVQASLLIN